MAHGPRSKCRDDPAPRANRQGRARGCARPWTARKLVFGRRVLTLESELLFLPVQLASQAFIEPDARRPAEMPQQFTRVGARMTLIPGPSVLASDLGRPAHQALEFVQNVPHG